MSNGRHTITCASNLPGGRHPCNCHWREAPRKDVPAADVDLRTIGKRAAPTPEWMYVAGAMVGIQPPTRDAGVVIYCRPMRSYEDAHTLTTSRDVALEWKRLGAFVTPDPEAP